MASFDAGSIVARVKADISDFKRGMEDAQNHSHKLKDGINKLGHGVAVFARGAAVAGGVVAAFGGLAVKEFADAENSLANLRTVLNQTGKTTGVTVDQATNLANALQDVTRFSDEAIIEGESLLGTFNNIGKDVFPEATEVMLDMSTVLKQDVKSSAIQLGKALQDPIRGVIALRRVGVSLTEAQEKLITKMVESGNVMGAQKEILQILKGDNGFGGAAKAAGETFAGKLDILKNKFSDMQESVGKTIVDAIMPFAERLANFVNSDKFQAWLERLNVWLAENIPKAIDFLANTVWPFLKNVFDTTWPIVQILFNVIKGLFNFIKDNTWVIWAAAGALAAFKTAMMISSTISATRLAFESLVKFIISPTALGSFGLLAAAAGIAAGLIINAANKARAAWDKTAAAVEAAGRSNDEVIRKLKNLIATGTPAQKERAKKALKGLAEGGSFAQGGPVRAGVSYLVGELGPELFVPKQSGQIVPNGAMGASSTQIYGDVNIGSEVDADNFLARLTRNQELASKGLTTLS